MGKSTEKVPVSGVELIGEKRHRQIHEKYYSPEQDDTYVNEELAEAASFYAMSEKQTRRIIENIKFSEFWPFIKKPNLTHTRKDELIKAGALIAAELDRLLRIEEKEK